MNKKHVFNVPDVKMLPSAAAAEKLNLNSEGILFYVLGCAQKMLCSGLLAVIA